MVNEPDHEFARNYDPKRPPKAYEWVLAHGHAKIDLCNRLVDVLEAKAESLMRYIGGIALAVSAGLPLLLKDGPRQIVLFSPSFIFLIFAAICAFKVIKPRGWPALPTIDQAFHYADFFDQDAEVRFHATMATVESRLASLIEEKSRALRVAQRYFLSALLWLPVGAVLSSVCSACFSAPSSLLRSV